MPKRRNDSLQYDNHTLAKEWLDGAAHVHRVAELNGMPDHLTGQERSRQALEDEAAAHTNVQRADFADARHTNGHGLITFGHDEIAALALELWRVRGCPEGTPEEDWTRAVAILRAGSLSR